MLFKDKPDTFVPATIPSTARQRYLNIAYASDEHHTLDIYLPTGETTFPVILDIYGGGLLRGRKSSVKLNPSLRFLADGFAVISLNYRLNTPAKNYFPNQIADIRAALDFLRQHANGYQLDMNNVTLIGESSGAQLAALSAASFSAQVSLGTLGSPQTDHSFPIINSIIGLYGPYQVDQFQEQFLKLNITPKFQETGQANAFEAIMLNNTPPKLAPDLVIQANPATYFTSKMPPLMLIAGTKDSVVPYLQSVSLAEAYYKTTGKHAITHWVSGGGHGPKDYDTDVIYQKKLSFIRQHIKTTAITK